MTLKDRNRTNKQGNCTFHSLTRDCARINQKLIILFLPRLLLDVRSLKISTIRKGIKYECYK